MTGKNLPNQFPGPAYNSYTQKYTQFQRMDGRLSMVSENCKLSKINFQPFEEKQQPPTE